MAHTPSALRPPQSSVDAIADVTVASCLAPLDPSVALALSPDGEMLLVGLEGGKLAAHRLADSSGNGEREGGSRGAEVRATGLEGQPATGSRVGEVCDC